jgi:hypothetical protein
MQHQTQTVIKQASQHQALRTGYDNWDLCWMLHAVAAQSTAQGMLQGAQQQQKCVGTHLQDMGLQVLPRVDGVITAPSLNGQDELP